MFGGILEGGVQSIPTFSSFWYRVSFSWHRIFIKESQYQISKERYFKEIMSLDYSVLTR